MAAPLVVSCFAEGEGNITVFDHVFEFVSALLAGCQSVDLFYLLPTTAHISGVRAHLLVNENKIRKYTH